MAILEQIMQMKNQGMSDQDIMNALQEQGISPKIINDALAQAQIKNAVINEQTPNPESPPVPQEGIYSPATQELPATNQMTSTIPEEEYPTYQENQYAESYTGGTTDTMIDVAEQVFNEKISKIQEQLDKLNEFQTLAQSKIDTTAQRLRKIESTIDQLQAAILRKVGSYGGTLESIKEEMSMMQDSFNKLIKHTTSSSQKRTAHKK